LISKVKKEKIKTKKKSGIIINNYKFKKNNFRDKTQTLRVVKHPQQKIGEL